MVKRHGHLADRIRRALKINDMPPTVRRVVVGVAGGTLLALGLAMVVLPGPAFVVVPIALAVLATEFVWAKRYMRKARILFRTAKNSVFGK